MRVKPRYKHLSLTQFDQKTASLRALLNTCTLCPHACKVDRLKGEVGFCQAGKEITMAGWSPHFGEEDVLVTGNAQAGGRLADFG